MDIFPNSPIWANIQRTMDWAEEQYFYDSGAYQGSTPRQRPLWEYRITAQNFNEIKQTSMEAFDHTIKTITPFLIKDPYDYTANGVTQASSINMNSGDGFYLQEVHSYRVLPDSANFYISDPASGELIATSHYVMSLDNGFVTMLVAVSSLIVSSFEFFRKVARTNKPSQSSTIWNNFSTSIIVREIPPGS